MSFKSALPGCRNGGPGDRGLADESEEYTSSMPAGCTEGKPQTTASGEDDELAVSADELDLQRPQPPRRTRGRSTKAMQFTRFHTASTTYLSDSSPVISPSHFAVSLAT